ncbi:MAG: hypothetical protein AB1898_07730 [Acidobacteriota bacterium]
MKKEKFVVKTFISRKSKRVPLRVRFKVNGRDVYGNQFEEAVETMEVGSNGGSFHTKYEIRVGSTLKLTGPKGFVCLIKVIWIKEDFKAKRRRLGFQLLEPRADWVVQSQDRDADGPSRKKPS